MPIRWDINGGALAQVGDTKGHAVSKSNCLSCLLRPDFSGWKRLNSCGLVLADRPGDHAERLPFLTSNVPPTTFSTELKLEHLMRDSEMQLTQKLAEYRPFNDVPVVLFSPSQQACALRFTPTLHKTMGMSCAVFCPISMHPSRALKWVRSSCSKSSMWKPEKPWPVPRARRSWWVNTAC